MATRKAKQGHGVRQPSSRGTGGTEESAVDLRLIVQRGTTSGDVEDLCHLFQAYIRHRDLAGTGDQLRWTISTSDQDLSVTDVIDVMIWLMDQPCINTVLARLHHLPNAGRATIVASRSDLALQPLVELYKLHRLPAEVVASALAWNRWADPSGDLDGGWTDE